MLQDRNLLRPPFQLALRSLLLGSLSLTTFLACSDSGKDGQVGDDTEASLGGEGGGPSDPAEDDPGAEGTGGTANGKKIEELKLKPLSLESTTACALDSDCQAGASCFQNICAIECETDDECLSGESCNERGRCVDEDGKTVASSVFSGARIAEVLDPVRSVSIGQSFAQVQLEKDAPAGGLLYISGEREDGMAQLARATVDPDDKTIVRFDLPAKTAAKSRRVNIRTAAGPVAVVENDPSLSSGTYAGTLLLDGFGSLGVPLRFTIQTSSEDGSLSQDSPAWIVFDVAGDNLFSPTNGEVQSVARELVFDEFSQAWVAQVAQPWILDEDSLFPWLGGLETTRSMRFELTSTEVGFTGTVKDIWSGFYEERDGIGKLDQQPVSLSGTLDVTFVNSVEFAEPTVDTYVAQTPALFPLPALSECLDGVLKAASFDTGSETLDCASTASLDDFESGGAEDAARCALAVAGNALEGETVSAQIDTYIAGGSVGARSFAEYLDACAANEDDICLPSQEILCARQLTAHALKRQPSNSAYIDQLLAQFQAATREANLGAQFGAFHADANTRLAWLQASDFPALVTSAVQAHMDSLLDDWTEDVLEVHFGVLAAYLDESGAVALGHQAVEDSTIEARKLLLMEASQAFGAAMDGLTLATQRWDTLLQFENDREKKSNYAGARLRDLYVAAALLVRLNQEAGNGALNATIASGFKSLLEQMSRLGQPFSRLQFSREGEVVVSHSLNPEDGNSDLLARLQKDAQEALDEADVGVAGIITSAQESALKNTLLFAELDKNVTLVRDELIQLCGLPNDCSASEFTSVDGECAVDVRAGFCGTLGGSVDTASASEAGAAVLDLISAIAANEQARLDFQTALSTTQLYQEQTEAFAAKMKEWASDRSALSKELEELAGQIGDSRNDAVAQIADLIIEQESLRTDAFSAQQASIEKWSAAGTLNTNEYFDELRTQWDKEDNAQRNLFIADSARELAQFVGDIARDFDTLTTLGGLGLAIIAAEGGALAAETYFEGQVLNTTDAAEKARIDAERTKELEEGNIDQATQESELALEEALGRVDALSAQMESVQASSDAEVAALEGIMDALERDVLYAEQAERDQVELDDRKVEYKSRVAQLSALHGRISQTTLTIDQKRYAYFQLVSEAQLLMGRYEQAYSLRDRVDQIVGSPAAVFAWSNKLIRAEFELDRVKDQMMDWLVALEYAAVRPFYDQRLRLLLARNATQLAEIFEELKDLQDNCGGAENKQTVELSMRDDLLALSLDQTDAVTGNVLAPVERFRELLEAGSVPIDRRVRYSTDGTVGSLVSRGGILAASFSLDIESFANLQLSCNARVQSLAVQLVGEGLGKSLPTVNILYDGTSQLRSCQPDIEDLVDLVGPETTVFDTVTSFRVAGRSVAPTAGVNEFTGDVNSTLRGLPLVSEYTVLIDKSSGDNADIDWSKLEDIKLQITYSYQDVFADDQSCGN